MKIYAFSTTISSHYAYQLPAFSIHEVFEQAYLKKGKSFSIKNLVETQNQYPNPKKTKNWLNMSIRKPIPRTAKSEPAVKIHFQNIWSILGTVSDSVTGLSRTLLNILDLLWALTIGSNPFWNCNEISLNTADALKKSTLHYNFHFNRIRSKVNIG